MNKKTKIDWLFIRKENGELSEDEIKELDQLLAESTEYQNAAAFQKDFESAFEDQDEIALYNEMEQMYGSYTKKKKKYTIYKIAAIFILVLGLGSIYLYQTVGKSHEERLFSSYYTAFSPPDDYRMADTSTNDTAKDAFSAYSKTEYKQADIGFQSLLIKHPENTSFLFYDGICQLQINQVDQAILCFKKIIDINDPVFKEPAFWYSSLCYLKIKRVDKVKEFLNATIMENGTYNKQAKELLDKLDNK